MSTNLGLHPRPAWTAVAIEEVRAVGLAMRRELVGIIALLAAFGGFFIWLTSRPGYADEYNFQPEALMPAVLLALVVPLAVWRSESPQKRTYLWSLPLSRRTAHLTKLASGWVWAMAALALYVLFAWGMAVATEGLVWEKQVYLPVDNAAGPLRIEDVPTYVYPMAGWLLLVPFAAATVLYLLGSIVVLSSNHPFRWAAGIWIVLMGVGGIVELRDDFRLAEAREALLAGEVVPKETSILELVLANENPWGVLNILEPEITRPEPIPGTELTRGISRGVFSHWLSSIALWGGLALVGAYVAAAKHREP